VTLGNWATRYVLGPNVSISRVRGQRFTWNGRTVIPTFHPAAILHGGGEKSRQFQLLKDDFALVRSTLDDPGPSEAAELPTSAAREPVTPEPASAVPEATATASAPGVTDRIVVPETDPADDQLELF